jgi:hypothetical protein
MLKMSTYHTYCRILISLLLGGSIIAHAMCHPGTLVLASIDTTEDSAATVPRLAGWVLKGLNWYSSPPAWETETVIQTMRSYGVNAIRRHFASAPLLEYNMTTKTAYFQRWHNVATWCAQNGMWVIYDFYGRSISVGKSSEGMRWVWEMPETDFLEMWRIIAQEMKGHGNVLLELGNEPNDFGVTDPTHRDIWLQRCIKAITVIRQEGFTGYIVIPLPEGASWAHPVFPYRPQVVDADPLDRFMWGFHYYWYHHEYQIGTPNDYTLDDVQEWLDVRGISALLATGDRVLCGEFGVQGQHPDPRDLQWFQNLLTVLTREGYDMICEAYLPGYNFPQVTGELDASDWRTLNTQGNMYVEALPLNLQYYTYPPLEQEQNPLEGYPRPGANKRLPGCNLGTWDLHSPIRTIRSIHVTLLNARA